MPVITDEFRIANYYEAAFWIAIGIVALIIALRKNGYTRGRSLMLAFTMFVFGPSDIVEAHTGAWWRPWWLLVWKGLCVVALAALLVEYYWRRFAAKRERK